MQHTRSMSRRGLLTAAPMAAAAALLPLEAAPASDVPPLPAPIPADTFRERQARLESELTRAGLDAALVVPSTNLHYLAAADPGRSERLMALLLRPGKPSVFVSPMFEEDRVRRDAVVR